MFPWTLVGCFALFVSCCHTAVSTGSYRREMEQDSVLGDSVVGPEGSKEKRSDGSGDGDRNLTFSKDCEPKWSSIDPKHTMCLVDVGEEVVLDQVTKDALLRKHNELRGKVAPPAGNMAKLVWDDDLALVAAKWARQCVMGHDEFTARRVPSLPDIYVGQNGAFGYYTFIEEIEAFYNESKDFKYGYGAIGDAVVGHYTQLVAARSQRVGCGQALCVGKPYLNYYFCNYAVGQYGLDLKKPYSNSSTSCSACSTKCDSSGKLCDCKGKICLNRGRLNISTCSCTCYEPYYGDFCEKDNCPAADAGFCKTFSPSACKEYYYLNRDCPYMCDICRKSV